MDEVNKCELTEELCMCHPYCKYMRIEGFLRQKVRR